MRFYRVCHRTDRTTYPVQMFKGPYVGHQWHPGCLIDEMGWAHTDRLHPCPYADSYQDPDPYWFHMGDWLCGFESIHRLNEWFDGWFGRIMQCGFVVREYEIPREDLHIGRCQTVAHARAMDGNRALRIHPITRSGVLSHRASEDAR